MNTGGTPSHKADSISVRSREEGGATPPSASQSTALRAQEGRPDQAGHEVDRRKRSTGCPAEGLQENAGVAQDECNTDE